MRLDDSVLHRIVQIVQEGIIMGIDVADLMRQIRLTKDDSDPELLKLEHEYVLSVEKEHQRAVAEAEEKKSNSSQRNLVFS